MPQNILSPIFIRFLGLIVISLSLFSSAFSLPPAAENPSSMTWIQPDEIPGNWEYRQPPLPDLNDILEQARPNPYIYGLYVWKGEYLALRESIQAVGWQSFRCGGDLDDPVMTAFAQDGVEVMLSVSTGRVSGSAQEEQLVNDYPDRLISILKRYGPEGSFFKEHPSIPHHPIRHLEIGNEPNFHYMIPDDGRSQIELETARESLYAKLLPAAYTKVKETFPEVNIVGFSAGGSGAGDIRFVEHVHGIEASPPVASSYDIFSTHPYVDPAPPEAFTIRSWGSYSIASSLERLRQIFTEHDRSNVPIWYTEIGWPISKADGGRFETEGTHPISPLLQAAYICRLYAFAQRLGIERVHVMFATDTDNYNAGFFRQDENWRPSAFAVQTMIHLMPSPRLIEAISDGTNGIYVYRFARGDNSDTSVIMAWSVQGSTQVELPLSSKSVVVTNMLGQTRNITIDKNQISLEIGPFPLYLTQP